MWRARRPFIPLTGGQEGYPSNVSAPSNPNLPAVSLAMGNSAVRPKNERRPRGPAFRRRFDPDLPASICASWRRPAHTPELRRSGWRCSGCWLWPAPLPASGLCCTDLLTGRPRSADRVTSPPPRSSPPSSTVNRLRPPTRAAGSPIPCPISSLSHRLDCCTTLEYDPR